MEILGFALIIIGIIIGFVFGIQLLILAFQTSVLWGLGYIFVPFVALIFIIMHWNETKTPFLRSLIAFPLYIIGALLIPAHLRT